MSDIKTRILDMTTRQQAKAWCELNCWHWPEAFADIKPDGWDALANYQYPESDPLIDTKSSHPLFRELIDSLAEICPRKEQSRYWNTVLHTGEYGMTDAEFEAWWNNGCKHPNKETP